MDLISIWANRNGTRVYLHREWSQETRRDACEDKMKRGDVSDGGKTTQEGFCDYYYFKFVKKSLTWIQKVYGCNKESICKNISFLDIFRYICFVYLDEALLSFFTCPR